jgi:hypothetical protein
MTFLSGIGFIVRIIGLILFHFYGWVVIVAILGYLMYQNKRKVQWINETDSILLKIEVPKDNEKKELSAEQMFAALHGILRPKSELRKEGSLQEHISFEIVAASNTIQFYVWTPRHLKDFVESQIYAQYPSVQIREGAEDYTEVNEGEGVIYGTELHLAKNEVIPIRTFASFEVDPLAGITAVLAKLDAAGEQAWIQVLSRPTDDSWHEKGKKFINDTKNGKQSTWGQGITKMLLDLPGYIAHNFLGALSAPPTAPAKPEAAKAGEVSTGTQAIIKAVEEKGNKLGFEVKIRILYRGTDEVEAKHRMQAIIGGFKQFNTTNLNGFATTKYYNSHAFVEDYRARLFHDSGYILNIEELASLYHLPHKSVETPNMVWTTSKTSEPPFNLPSEKEGSDDEISLFGLTNFRGTQLKFGLKRKDRGRHAYIIGQTGAGKSFLLELLTLSDIYHDKGFAIIDPHGDFATDMLKYIPEHRLKDVVYFSPSDRDFPMAFNPMEVSEMIPKDHISSELVGVLKRMFDSWGPRLEYILRYTILALLDFEGATMLDITRMLNEKDFRKKVIAQIQDPVVKSFWITEYASWNEKFASEAVAPVLNKVGAFTANPLVRNIVGQQKSAFNIRKIMDEGKILIVNLSRGQVGEDNAAILGALMVTKIQLAAMSRADITDIEQRRPFYLYVDEFQNFATDSFAVILSEARKYGLNLTVANQYVSQMPDVVREAVFGNVGTMMSFRVGPGDSTVLGKYFEPEFEATDLTRLNNQNIFISMIINGEKAPAFSATTLRMPAPENDRTAEIIANSRELYATDRATVEASIRTRTAGLEDTQTGAPAPTMGTAENGMPTVHSGSHSPAHAVVEQKPNSFLAGLKNPAAPAHTQAPRQAGNRDDKRGSQNRSAGHNDKRHSSSSPSREQQDRKVREAIASARNDA